MRARQLSIRNNSLIMILLRVHTIYDEESARNRSLCNVMHTKVTEEDLLFERNGEGGRV